MFLFDSENIHFGNHWHKGLSYEPELLLFLKKPVGQVSYRYSEIV